MKYINTCLLACLLLSAAMASAGPSAHRTQGESGLLNNLFGSGISNTAGEFRYESSLHADGLRLQSAWTRRYRSGHTRSGRSTLISR